MKIIKIEPILILKSRDVVIPYEGSVFDVQSYLCADFLFTYPDLHLYQR